MRTILLTTAAALALTSAAAQADEARDDFNRQMARDLARMATAQQCGPRDKFAEVLAKKYGEAPVAVGLQSNGMLFEVYASPDGKSWTALSTTPTRVSCILAAGKGWSGVELLMGEPS